MATKKLQPKHLAALEKFKKELVNHAAFTGKQVTHIALGKVDPTAQQHIAKQVATLNKSLAGSGLQFQSFTTAPSGDCYCHCTGLFGPRSACSCQCD